jgi:hypothetical protein
VLSLGKQGFLRTLAALDFAKRLVDRRGRVSEPEMDEMRRAGFRDCEIDEIVTRVNERLRPR